MIVGDQLFKATAMDGKLEFDLYVVRSKRRGYWHLIQKNDCTWVKRSKKHLDYGWDTSIDPVWRDRHPVDQPISKHFSLATTKIAAARKCLATLRKSRERWKDAEWADEDEADIKALSRYIKRHSKMSETQAHKADAQTDGE